MTIESAGGPPRDPRQDPDFHPVAESKRLLRSIRTATLATLTGAGAPFATLTAIATDYDGAPILLLSKLWISHRQSRARWPLFAVAGAGRTWRPDGTSAPDAGRDGRTHAKLDRPRALSRPQPKGAALRGFSGFFLLARRDRGRASQRRLRPRSGFRPRSLSTDLSGAEPLLAAEADIVAHMNADHGDALGLYAEKLAGAKPGQWRASGVDPRGLTSSAATRRCGCFSRHRSEPPRRRARSWSSCPAGPRGLRTEDQIGVAPTLSPRAGRGARRQP